MVDNTGMHWMQQHCPVITVKGDDEPLLEGDDFSRVVLTIRTVNRALKASSKLQKLQKMNHVKQRTQEMRICADKFFKELQEMLDEVPNKDIVSQGQGHCADICQHCQCILPLCILPF